MALRQSASSNVVNRALRNAVDAIVATAQPPTEVYLLHVGEETLVQASFFPKNIGSDK